MVDAQGLKANGKIFLLISVLTGVFLGTGYLLGGTGGVIIDGALAGVMNVES